MPRPTYSMMSRRLSKEGRAVVSMIISDAGQVEQANLSASSGYPRLDQAALEAARRIRCEPYLENGRAIRISVAQPFDFKLQD
ncbi:MAG: energy transducer TonB [Candidatus Protistobacter heckmanni]|nr:energy transducer TonB [Candidatus Protistobacter heckmanni]